MKCRNSFLFRLVTVLISVKTSFLHKLGTHDHKKYLRYGKINIRVNIRNQTETLF